MNRRMAWTAALAAVLAVPTGLLAQDSYTVRGEEVAIDNLAGEVEVVGGSGSAVTVQVTRGGDDGGSLDIQVGEVDGHQTLRVIYPSDRVVYSAGRWGGSTNVRVRSDGTWGSGGWLSRGDQVRVSSRGSGLEAHADLHLGLAQLVRHLRLTEGLRQPLLEELGGREGLGGEIGHGAPGRSGT